MDNFLKQSNVEIQMLKIFREESVKQVAIGNIKTVDRVLK